MISGISKFTLFKQFSASSTDTLTNYSDTEGLFIMTYLGWQYTNGSFEIAMDTLAKTGNGSSDVFFEKTYFFEKLHILMSVKGMANFGSEIALRLKKQEAYLQSKVDFLNYAKEISLAIGDSLNRETPYFQQEPSTVTFFHFQDKEPVAMRIQKLKNSSAITFSDLIITEGDHLSSNTTVELEVSPEVRRYWTKHSNVIRELQKDIIDLTYVTYGITSHFRDPDEGIHVGGRIIRYSLSPNEFTRKILFHFEDDVPNEDYFTLEEVSDYFQYPAVKSLVL